MFPVIGAVFKHNIVIACDVYGLNVSDKLIFYWCAALYSPSGLHMCKYYSIWLYGTAEPLYSGHLGTKKICPYYTGSLVLLYRIILVPDNRVLIIDILGSLLREVLHIQVTISCFWHCQLSISCAAFLSCSLPNFITILFLHTTTCATYHGSNSSIVASNNFNFTSSTHFLKPYLKIWNFIPSKYMAIHTCIVYRLRWCIEERL